MQCKEEMSSGQSCMWQYSEGAAQFLTPRCAKSGGGVACSAGKQAAAMRESSGRLNGRGPDGR